MSNSLLIIFTRNPELGKVKTRLAATIGDQAALDIYTLLLEHTASITKDLDVDKQVHYSVAIRENDLWDNAVFDKKQQHGSDLGARMERAFQQGFEDGYERIVIIGSDMYDLSTRDLEEAFSKLEEHDFVIGPAEDGGYYLLGMKRLKQELFRNKAWGTHTVLPMTLEDLEGESMHWLPIRNDVDVYEDIKNIQAFRDFLRDE